MSIAELRLQLHEVIDTLSDKEQLEAIYTLLKREDSPMKRMTKEEYTSAIDESIDQIIKGQFLTQEELEKESENW
ncbi:hypothetical protein [uncultured Roseivirga sp.]|mgnify:CR=1 FL=1|uniref:hypothetical protein n=1 Tax=uncultured Roseivirga sp. TaxID=543088 RepID=UPI000D795506|nr:hypothetical protein [uncultured Roseivirga sp.]PWL28043.1 MAG: hypothetical protein DCO95_16385 [Roseivirga sp. XM-24bin3]